MLKRKSSSISSTSSSKTKRKSSTRISFYKNPVFRASDFGSLLYGSEKDELIILSKMYPFKDYFKQNVNLSSKIQDIVKKELVEQLEQLETKSESNNESNEIKFDDEAIVTTIDKLINIDVDNKDLNLTIEEIQEAKISKEEIKEAVALSRGVCLEEVIMDAFNEKYQKKFVKDDQLLWWNAGKFRVCGRVDGFDKDDKSILEIKTTNNVDLDEPYSRHTFQCQLYMKMLNVDKTYLFYQKSNGDQSYFELEPDENAIKTVKETIECFLKKYDNISETTLKNKLVRYNMLNNN